MNTAVGLDIRHISLVYPDGYEALKNVSLSAAPGEIVALLGASGSGKSTVLRAVAGLEPIASGDVLIDGESVAGVPTHKRGVGMVFQDGLLFPQRSVERNIAYGLEMAGVDAGERKARVEEMLALVGLEGYGPRDVATLSGGQAQRVALARSLAPRPRVMLLDEPLSALDQELRGRLAVEIREILKGHGTTALFVTHDPAEADVLADRVVRIADGVLAS
ncbi:thiamine transport system ATP-binding protein [Arcanobacterium wilhelmae]|uniref:Thiamine transport system ATP-binding protein n=1 Tax=Arcanobacterium wilhelmae TaxID=1803177 RepID=A0ABT9N8V6_9ACTO|nr:ABC transporter ATP-binding protein [Arcanobacterium wilhelmae]MDP9800139.1 thiamine transport system ATP-binding protein [Arcanobacterium wilhelmae]WFN89580.1 ABC transporter ATP-binding protein [Arcanobacterium wilhelmae]